VDIDVGHYVTSKPSDSTSETIRNSLPKEVAGAVGRFVGAGRRHDPGRGGRMFSLAGSVLHRGRTTPEVVGLHVGTLFCDMGGVTAVVAEA